MTEELKLIDYIQLSQKFENDSKKTIKTITRRREKKKMTFEEIFTRIEKGAKIIRKGWSGFELYVVLVSDDEFDGCPVTPYLLIKTSDEGFSSFAPTVCMVF